MGTMQWCSALINATLINKLLKENCRENDRILKQGRAKFAIQDSEQNTVKKKKKHTETKVVIEAWNKIIIQYCSFLCVEFSGVWQVVALPPDDWHT